MGHSNLPRRIWLASVLSLCVIAAGCTPLFRNHGFAPSDDELADVIVGVDTRDSVAETVGPPSAAGVLNDQGYYYVSKRVRTFAYRAPEIIDRQVVAISFDAEGVVTNVERFTLQDGNVVALSRRVTDSNIEGISFLQQLLGNIGNLDPGTIFGRN